MSSKACACGNTRLVLLRSYREKHCTDCHATIHWPLDEGQKPLHQPHRADRKEVRTHGK